MRVVCTRGWIFQRIETCVAAPYMYSGMPRTNECFPVYTVGGRIGPDQPMSSSNSTFFPSPLSSFLPPVDDKRIGTNTNTHHLVSSTTKHARLLLLLSSFADRFTPWNLIHCSFRNATNAMARGTASLLHAIFNVSPNRLSRKNVQTAII